MDNKEKLEKVARALEKNNIKVYIVENKTEARKKVKSLLKKGESVSNGGSMTMDECDIYSLLESGDYDYLDRRKAQTREEQIEIYRKSYFVDTYFSSANAITEQGEIYNVDGNSNRVSAITYGPKSVILIVGMNKVVKNLEEAILRVKTIAAPLNAKRLNCNTYCKETGKCMSFLNGTQNDMGSGCNSDDRICCNYLVSAQQRIKDRIKVILVAENLGY